MAIVAAVFRDWSHGWRCGRCDLLAGLLVAMLFTPRAVPAQQTEPEFSLRLRSDASEAMVARVRLYAVCGSFECGVNWLGGAPKPAPQWSATFAGGGRFRPFGEQGEGALESSQRDWWVVVEGDSLPVAWLWRPGTGADDLPPAPRLSGGNCTATVLSHEGGAAIPGAIVVPIQKQSQTGDEVYSGAGRWRAWLAPVVTSSNGHAVLQVAADGEATVRVGAPGFLTAEAQCRPTAAAGGSATTVLLRRRGATREFQLTAESGGSLADALVRDESGWPVALGDAAGRVRLDERFSGWWVETSRGEIYFGRPSEEAAFGKIDLQRVSKRLEGTAAFPSGQRMQPARPQDTARMSSVEFWLDPPERAWSDLHVDLAALRRGASGGAFDLHGLSEDRIWFTAAGLGYERCSSSELVSRSCPEMKPALPINGRVVDDRGRELANVEIELTRRRSRRGGPSLRQFLRTRVDGRFVSDRLPAPGRFLDYIAVAIRHPGFLPLESGISDYRTQQDEYVIELQRGVIVTGSVLDRDTGLAVSGAEVALGRFSAQGTVMSLNGLSALRLGKKYAGRTDGEGRFTIRSPPGRHDLAIWTPQHAFRLVRGIEVAGVETLELGAVFLEAGLVFEGRVVDDASRPIVGAHISAIAQRTPDALGRNPMVDNGDAIRLITDREGLFSVPGLPPYVRLDVTAAAAGFLARTLRGLTPGADPVEIRLGPGAVLTGRLTRGGEPVAGSFELFGSANRGFRDPLTRDPGYVMSGPIASDGRFEVAHLAADRYRLLARSLDGEEKRVIVELQAGDERRLELALDSRSGRVTGRVVDRQTGLPGATVRLDRVLVTTSDATGRFAFDDVPTGTVVLEADLGNGDAVRTKAVRARGGETRVTLDFSRYVITGRALLPRRARGVGDMRLTFWSPGSRGDERATATADAEGHFRVRLRSGEYVVGGRIGDLRVFAPKNLRVTGDAADVNLRLRLVPAGRIVGRVHGLAEDEVATLRVEAVNRELTSRAAAVSADSTFSIDRLAEGEWTVVGVVGSSSRRATRGVEVQAGEAWVDLIFESAHAVSGIVRLDGVPWPDAQVLVMPEGRREETRRQFTGHDGSFVFRDVESGNHIVAAGAEVRPLRVEADEWVELQLVSGKVQGLVLGSKTGLPETGATVALWPAAATRSQSDAIGSTRTSWTNAEGHFVFESVPSGEWVLEASGRPATRQRLSVEPGRDVVVAVQ